MLVPTDVWPIDEGNHTAGGSSTRTADSSAQPPQNDLRLSLFGPPVAMLDGRQLRFRRRSAVALLAYLVVTGRASTRAQLAALLTDDPAYGPALLRNSLLELRAHLGTHLRIVGQSVTLDPTLAVQTDLAALDEALATSGVERPTKLQAAVAGCNGEFLESLNLRGAYAFEEWQRLERERLHTLLMGATEELCAACWQDGRIDEALAYARRLLTAEPWHEGAHRAVMLLLLQQGRRGEALAQYDACRVILESELAAGPAPETEAVYRRVVAEAPAPHNLPPEPAPLVGRVSEQATIARWLDSRGCRAVTVTGPGGVGKTRLALRVAARYIQETPGPGWLRFPDGVRLVALDALPPDRHGPEGPSADRICEAVGAALGLPVPASPPQVVAALREQAMLLILDNVEHLAGARLALERLCAGAPSITVLLTSRGGVSGSQHTLELGPLELPAGSEDLECAGASQLFLQAARQARLTFAPGAAEREAIVHICAAADGLPLALVQAAQLVRAMPCAAIAKRLAERPLELTAGLRNLPPRHQSLRASLTYSWDLLAASEQLAVRRHVEQSRTLMHAPHLGDDLALTLASVGLLARADRGALAIPPLLGTFLDVQYPLLL